MAEFISEIVGLLKTFVSWVLDFLPRSPIQPVIANMGRPDWLGVLNWFIPVGTFVAIGGVWLGAIALYYLYQVILRWLKVVGD